MDSLRKILVAVSVIGAGVGLGALAGVVIERRRTPGRRTGAAAGSMFVGAVDEIELGGGLDHQMHGGVDIEIVDVEVVPSEHSEINELREKMPFGR